MRKLAVLVAGMCLFGAAPYVAALGNVGGSLVVLGLGLVLALAASSAMSSLAVVGGAAGAFAGTVLGTVSPAVGAAVLVALAYGERTLRVRGGAARLVHLGAALLGGALAGSLSGAYALATPAVRSVAVLVAGVLVALPLLVEADDPVAFALDEAARTLPDPAKTALSDGAELRRNVHDIPLEPETARHVRITWRTLLRLAEARARLERTRTVRALGSASPADSVAAMVDAKIRDHVAALSRAYTAADTVRAAEVGLDDAAMKNVENAGEALDEVSRAIVDVKENA